MDFYGAGRTSESTCTCSGPLYINQVERLFTYIGLAWLSHYRWIGSLPMGSEIGGVLVPARTPESTHAESGFTLLELLTTITIAGIVMATAVSGVLSFARAEQERSSAETLLASFRAAQTKAQTEGRTYCVRLDTVTTWGTWRYSCDPTEPIALGSPVQVDRNGTNGTSTVVSNTLSASAVSGLAHACPGAALGCAFFYPRGLASSGHIVIGRSGSSAQYTITVVGVTGRVFLTH